MNNTKNNDYCIDITKEWIKNSTPNSHKVKEQYFFDYHGIRYRVDNKKVVLDYSTEELNIAIWLKETFGGEVYLLPRINEPQGIKTADYIFKGEKWDLKTIKGSSPQVLYHTIRKKSQQSNNFIFLILSELSLDEIIIQVIKLYKRTDIPFVDKIIIKKENSFLVFSRTRNKKRM